MIFYNIVKCVIYFNGVIFEYFVKNFYTNLFLNSDYGNISKKQQVTAN